MVPFSRGKAWWAVPGTDVFREPASGPLVQMQNQRHQEYGSVRDGRLWSHPDEPFGVLFAPSSSCPSVLFYSEALGCSNVKLKEKPSRGHQVSHRLHSVLPGLARNSARVCQKFHECQWASTGNLIRSQVTPGDLEALLCKYRSCHTRALLISTTSTAIPCADTVLSIYSVTF